MTYGEEQASLIIDVMNRYGYSKEMMRQAVLEVIDTIDEEASFDFDEYLAYQLEKAADEDNLKWFNKSKAVMKWAIDIFEAVSAIPFADKEAKVRCVKNYLENRKDR